MVALFSSLPAMSGTLPKGSGLNHSREVIAGGDLGTAQTIKRMRDLVTRGKRDERVRTQYVAPILNGTLYPFVNVPEKDYFKYCEALFLYCRDKIRYVHDPAGVEMLEDAWITLQRGAADCDSICICLASMCESIGRACRFVTLRREGGGPYFHVYLEVHIPGQGWVGADATMKDKPFGWKPDSKYPRTAWPASNDKNEVNQQDVAGLSEICSEERMDGFTYPGVQRTPEQVESLYEWKWQIEPAIHPAASIDGVVDSIFADKLGDLGAPVRRPLPRRPMPKKPSGARGFLKALSTGCPEGTQYVWSTGKCEGTPTGGGTPVAPPPSPQGFGTITPCCPTAKNCGNNPSTGQGECFKVKKGVRHMKDCKIKRDKKTGASCAMGALGELSGCPQGTQYVWSTGRCEGTPAPAAQIPNIVSGVGTITSCCPGAPQCAPNPRTGQGECFSIKRGKRVVRDCKKKFSRKGGTCLSGLLGDLSGEMSGFTDGQTPSDYELAEGMFTGDTARYLGDMRRRNQIDMGTLITAQNKINAMPDGAEKYNAQAAWQNAYNAQIVASNATNDAVAKYNAVVEFIISQPVVFGGWRPTHLGELGVAPVVVGALVGAGVLLALSSAIFVMTSSFKSKEGAFSDLNAILHTPGDTARSFGSGFLDFSQGFMNVADTTGKWAIVVAAGVAAYYVATNWSKVKGAFK
jgi:hypothetical protein